MVGERYKNYEFPNAAFPLVQLDSICQTASGGTPNSSTREYYENGTINWLKSGEVRQGLIYSSEQKITELGLKNSSAKIFPVDTVLVAMYGATAGQVGLLKVESATNQAICGILPSDRILPKFLFYLLKGKKEFLITQSTGGAQPNISQKIIRNLQIPLPSLSIQENIVAELDGYQKIIDGAQQVVDNYVPNVTIDKTWREISIGELYDISYGLTISIPQNEDNNGIKIISTAELCLDGSIDLSKIRKVRYEEKYSKFILPPNCLLFNWRNAPKHVGKTAIFTQEDDDYISASFLLTLINKADDKIDNRYAWWAINDLRRKGYFMRNARQAVNQTNFNGELLAQTKISVPSLDIQLDIISKFEEEMSIVKQNKRLIAIFEQKIADKISEVLGE